ncbi:MAG: trypsin-like peptidase domain-containing protein [Bacteroidia bacterium]|nr:trypsin-like peptidase domain-containing protein [Bacteroidia bacterium]MDW8134317.1 trypsin-like peptidase domain-containing protein [Bacteroidia bacterium]
MRRYHLIIVAVVAIASSIIAAVATRFFLKSFSSQPSSQVIIPLQKVRLDNGSETGGFVEAARRATPSVVFIRAVGERIANDDFWSYWGLWLPRTQPIYSAGSGVVWSSDGYIVTNFHVVKGASKILVTFPDKRTLPAELVGADASVDIALLKVRATNLPFLPLANSDSVQIGEWVLAIGNPYNLTYTVTAGIISAKGRNLNLLQGPLPIESFIQTDAAINPGNSGGALVNLKGQLVGINTAIASRTGSYVGYGFAIPVNIVRKVVEDLRQYGIVQRAFLDIEVTDFIDDITTNTSPEDLEGLYIGRVRPGGAADKAGLKTGDHIIALDGAAIQTQAELLERLAQHRPGEKVKITYKRNGRLYETTATLTNEEGEPTLLSRTVYKSERLGADIIPLSTREAERLGISQGYRVVNLRAGVLSQLGITEGFIIISINNYTPSSAKELEEILLKVRGRLLIHGIDAEGREARYSFSLR